MTTEEKAKAYDEALIKIRPLYERAKKDDCPIWSTYEYIFPELAESEDEKIRKEIISFLVDMECKGEWITYLIKQKVLTENGNGLYAYYNGVITFIGSYAQENPYDFAMSQQEKQKEQKDLELDGEDWTSLSVIVACINKCYGDKEAKELRMWLEEHYKEVQKPAEWSDTDNIGWDEAFACVTRAEKAAKNEEELQNAVTAEKWLNEIKFKYYVNPVKQEWSEEELIKRIKDLETSTKQWLKERFQAKWSEEDKMALKKAIDCVRSWEIDYCDGDNKISERLKSFRPQPHWKPSEEQEEPEYYQHFDPDC